MRPWNLLIITGSKIIWKRPITQGIFDSETGKQTAYYIRLILAINGLMHIGSILQTYQNGRMLLRNTIRL